MPLSAFFRSSANEIRGCDKSDAIAIVRSASRDVFRSISQILALQVCRAWNSRCNRRANSLSMSMRAR